MTRYNIAMIHRDAGQFREAVEQLEIVVELDRQVQHPDLASDTAMLTQIRAQLIQQQAATTNPDPSGPPLVL